MIRLPESPFSSMRPIARPLRNLRYTADARLEHLQEGAPSVDFPPDYHRFVEGAGPYPLWIKPDGKLALADVFSLMRDHYEGTEYDLTAGVDAGLLRFALQVAATDVQGGQR